MRNHPPSIGAERSSTGLDGSLHTGEEQGGLEKRILPLHPGDVDTRFNPNEILTKARSNRRLERLEHPLERGWLSKSGNLWRNLRGANRSDFDLQNKHYPNEQWAIYQFLTTCLDFSREVQMYPLIVGALFKLAMDEGGPAGGMAVWDYLIFYSARLGKKKWAQFLLQYCERPTIESLPHEEIPLSEGDAVYDPEKVRVNVEELRGRWIPTYPGVDTELTKKEKEELRKKADRRTQTRDMLLSVEMGSQDNYLIEMGAVPERLGMSDRAFSLLVRDASDGRTNLMSNLLVQRSGGWYMPSVYVDRLEKASEFDKLKATYEALIN